MPSVVRKRYIINIYPYVCRLNPCVETIGAFLEVDGECLVASRLWKQSVSVIKVIIVIIFMNFHIHTHKIHQFVMSMIVIATNQNHYNECEIAFHQEVSPTCRGTRHIRS